MVSDREDLAMSETEALWRIEEPLPKALAQGWVYLWVNGHCFQVLRVLADAIIEARSKAAMADRLAEALDNVLDPGMTWHTCEFFCTPENCDRKAAKAILADYRANEQPDSEASK